jgi:hypothetical protein
VSRFRQRSDWTADPTAVADAQMDEIRTMLDNAVPIGIRP